MKRFDSLMCAARLSGALAVLLCACGSALAGPLGKPPSATVVLVQTAGAADGVQAEGREVTPEALRRWIASVRAPFMGLVIRAEGLVDRSRTLLLLSSPGGLGANLPVETLFEWIETSEAEQLLLVLDLSGVSGLCQFGEMKRLLPSKRQLAFVCAQTKAGTKAAGSGLADLAGKRLTQPETKAITEDNDPMTAFGLLDELASAGGHPSTYRRGQDWLIPVEAPAPDAPAVDEGLGKLDADLTAVSAPGLDPETLDRLLQRLDASGVTVRRDGVPAIKVRVTAISAKAAETLRSEIESSGGEIGVVFDNTLFALVPVGQLRRLAGLESIWTLEVNRALSQPIGPQ